MQNVFILIMSSINVPVTKPNTLKTQISLIKRYDLLPLHLYALSIILVKFQTYVSL